jgi:hypothetical protein
MPIAPPIASSRHDGEARCRRGSKAGRTTEPTDAASVETIRTKRTSRAPCEVNRGKRQDETDVVEVIGLQQRAHPRRQIRSVDLDAQGITIDVKRILDAWIAEQSADIVA